MYKQEYQGCRGVNIIIIKYIIVVLLLSIPLIGFSQKDQNLSWLSRSKNDKQSFELLNSIKQSISRDTIKKHVYYLASDSLKGRGTGTEGQKIAAKYISSRFSDYNLKNKNNSYYQYFDLNKSKYGRVAFKNDGNRVYGWGTMLYSSNKTVKIKKENIELVFIGYGNKSLLENIDLNSKTPLLLAETIDEVSERIKYLKENFNINKVFVYLTNNKLRKKIFKLQKTPSRVYSSTDYSFDKLDKTINSDYSGVDVVWLLGSINYSAFGYTTNKLIEMGKDWVENAEKYNNLPTFKTELNIYTKWFSDLKHTENIVGYIEGSTYKDEFIIVCGHYDHTGVNIINDSINYGADDNASGTSGVMELARIFAKARDNGLRPNRSIVFMAFSGEELGLKGSKYYVNNPLFPLENTVAVYNMDMIGRFDKDHAENHDYVYVMHKGPKKLQYKSISRRLAKEIETELSIDFTPGLLLRLLWTFGSDHFNFVKKNIPAVLLLTGLHDDYHTPRDTPDKINFPNIENILKYAFMHIWELSNNTKY
ncbi:M28 family metallopeptidase [Bacteroidota bacterium]